MCYVSIPARFSKLKPVTIPFQNKSGLHVSLRYPVHKNEPDGQKKSLFLDDSCVRSALCSAPNLFAFQCENADLIRLFTLTVTFLCDEEEVVQIDRCVTEYLELLQVEVKTSVYGSSTVRQSIVFYFPLASWSVSMTDGLSKYSTIQNSGLFFLDLIISIMQSQANTVLVSFFCLF